MVVTRVAVFGKPMCPANALASPTAARTAAPCAGPASDSGPVPPRQRNLRHLSLSSPALDGPRLSSLTSCGYE